MTRTSINRFRLIYGILLSIVIGIAGLCLIAACINIYLSGDTPFSRESVAAAFSAISVPVYLCLAMVVLGFLPELILPATEQKPAVAKQYRVVLTRLQARTDLTGCDDALISAVRKERRHRKLHRWITVALLVLGGMIFLCYALDGSHFHQTDINCSMIRALWVLLPCMAVPFGYAVFTAYYAISSIRREIALLKQAPKAESIEACPAKKHACITSYLQYGVLAVAVVLLVYGFCTGGTVDVLTKAINICTECVGLG